MWMRSVLLTWVNVCRFHTEFRMKNFPRDRFSKSCKSGEFFWGVRGVQADVYTSWGWISVTGFQFHSKNSMLVVDFGKFTIPIPEIADLLRLLWYILAEWYLSVVSFRNFNNTFLSIFFPLIPDRKKQLLTT